MQLTPEHTHRMALVFLLLSTHYIANVESKKMTKKDFQLFIKNLY